MDYLHRNTKLLVAFAIGFQVGLWMCYFARESHWQRQAIEHGAARYVCDPETGVTKFEWLTKPKGERE